MSQCSLVPRNVTASVAIVLTVDCRNYLLWRNSRTLIIQVPGNINTVPSGSEVEQQRRDTNHTLEVIQTVIDHSKFETMNWGYLVPSPGGDYRIVYRNRVFRPIRCRTWAPLVDEYELVITKWIDFESQTAIWKGRKVELIMARDDYTLEWVERETKSRELLVGLDVSFEVLAHVVRDGEVVGLMLEQHTGRGLEPGDRAVVYDAVARMQRHGLIFRDWQTFSICNIAITDGKVRFRCTSNILRFDKKDVEAMDRYQHWWALEYLFENVPPRDGRCAYMPGDVDFAQHAVLLPNPIYPERPLLGMREIFVKIEEHYIHHMDHDTFFSFVHGESRNKKKSNRRRSNKLPLVAPDGNGERRLVLEDTPYGHKELLSLVLSSGARRQARISYPQRPRRKTLILANDDLDT